LLTSTEVNAFVVRQAKPGDRPWSEVGDVRYASKTDFSEANRSNLSYQRSLATGPDL